MTARITAYLWFSLVVLGQAPSAEDRKPVEGIPVRDPLVVSKCGTCHKQDEKGNLSRISWERTTPEGWEQVIKRMVRLNGLTVDPADARAIVKSLSSSHGLAPEEAASISYMAEHRVIEETYPSDVLHSACASCHPRGRAASFRRSPDEWKLLADLHVAMFPVSESTALRRRRAPNPAGPGPGPAAPEPQPVDQALQYLSKTFPLQTSDWSAWQAKKRVPKLAGRWLISAHIAGKGAYTGEMMIASTPAADEFTTRTTLRPLSGGPPIQRTGKVVVFNSYAWRGRSTGPAGSGLEEPSAEIREAMMISADQSEAQGRWFWGGYSEFGVDVKLRRATGAPAILAVDRASLKAGSQTQRVRILGDALPGPLTSADVDFGSGISVRRVVSSSQQEIVAEVDVGAAAISGRRDILVRGTYFANGLAVYDRIDSIRVLPGNSLARLGGASKHPKGYQQFEVMAYHRGADGQPNTPDDVELGPVDVAWSIDEFHEIFGDDDKEFVGSISATGLFTPASDGPNPAREQMRNNYGTVWVKATAKNEKDSKGNALTGRSYLVVAPPLFVIWDQELAP